MTPLAERPNGPTHEPTRERIGETATSRKRERIALLAVVALGAMLRLWAIGAEPLWLDEAFSVWVAAHNMPDLVRFVASVDHHPPLYYLLLHGWQRTFGDAQATVRLLSALLGVAAIPLFYFGGRILVGRRAAWIAALLLAVSPFHVRYGQEARHVRVDDVSGGRHVVEPRRLLGGFSVADPPAPRGDGRARTQPSGSHADAQRSRFPGSDRAERWGADPVAVART